MWVDTAGVVKRREGEKCEIPGGNFILTLLLAHPATEMAEKVGSPAPKNVQSGQMKKSGWKSG
jgi:hypothetical protein